MIGSTGNPNEASLEFSNNPNVGGEGETGKTPTDKVIVFTYQLDINKTFNGGTPAENDLPKFKLYKFDSATNDYTIDRDEVTITKTEDGKYTASFKRVDDGKYKLVETKTPAASTPPPTRSSKSPLTMMSSLTTRSLRCSRSTPLPAIPLPVRLPPML